MNTFLLITNLLLINFSNVDSDKAWKYHHLKADYYFHKGNYPEMLYHLQQKVKHNPKDLESYSDLGYYYWSMAVDNKNKSEEFKAKALNYLKLGVKNNPESSYMVDELGRYFIYKSKDFLSAIPYFEEAIKKPNCDNIAFHLLALCYEKNNRINDAIKTLNECLTRFPDDAKAKSKLDSFKD